MEVEIETMGYEWDTSDRQRQRETANQTNRDRETQRDIQTVNETNRERQRETHTQRDTERETHTGRDTDYTERQRETHRETQRESERKRDTHRERERERDNRRTGTPRPRRCSRTVEDEGNVVKREITWGEIDTPRGSTKWRIVIGGRRMSYNQHGPNPVYDVTDRSPLRWPVASTDPR